MHARLHHGQDTSRRDGYFLGIASVASPAGTAFPSCDGQAARSTAPPGRAAKCEKNCRWFSQNRTVLPRTERGGRMENRPLASGQRSVSGLTTLPPEVTPTTRPE